MAYAPGMSHPRRERARVRGDHDRSRCRRESGKADELLGECAEYDNPSWMLGLYPLRQFACLIVIGIRAPRHLRALIGLGTGLAHSAAPFLATPP
jgi:hypothetical protein